MRTLILTPDFPPARGGIQLVMHRLATELAAETVVVTLDGAGAKTFDAGAPLEVHRVGHRGGRWHRMSVARLNLAALTRALRCRPAVVVSGHIVTAPAAALLRTAARIPLIQYLYADEVRSRPTLTRFAVRRADAVIAVSRHTRALAIAAGCEERRVHVIPPGVDLPEDDTRTAADRPTVLTVARLSDPYKGFDVVMRAMPLIRARVPDVEWVVVGDGPLLPSLRQLASSHGVDDCVRFIGSASDQDRDSWFARAHVFAMPSRLPPSGTGGEGFGIVYLEAAAHGLPVLAGAVGGALDAVSDGETGVLVDPADHRAVADALADLLLDPPRATALGEAGKRRARRFSWGGHANAISRVIGELAGG